MRRFLMVLFIIVTVLSVIVYLLGCLTPFISPEHFWPFTFLALSFPYLSLGYLLLVLIWLAIRKKTALYLAVFFLFGLPNISSVVALNFPSNKQEGNKKIRVLGWNVRYFDNNAIHADSPYAVRRKMLEYIERVNADVLCLQEFAENQGPSFLSNIKSLRELGYKYYYCPDEQRRNYPYGVMITGSVIFSKSPIVDTGRVFFNDPSYKEIIAYADINFNGKVTRFMSTHFRSYHLGQIYVDPYSRIPLHFDSSFIYRASKFEKLKAFDKEHAIDSKIARATIQQSPYPVIFSADLNSVPSSYAYHTVSKNMQDAFLEKGFGLGGSMDSMMKTLRIDVLLADDRIKIESYNQNRVALSDHFPHYIDVSLKR